MPTAHLHINTAVNRDTSNLKRPNDASAPTLMNLNMAVTRARSGSTASTSSSISVDSPGPSSSSASSSSLDLPDSEKSSRPLHYPLASPSDETVRVSPSPEFVLALHDFHPQHQNATCLSFRAGQVIHVLNRDSSGWWDGEINGQRGWFPSNYVSADERVISLAEEVLPQSPGSRHGHTMSAVSAASWASAPSRGSRKDHRPLVTEALGSDITSYCPPLMVNLLHSLSLLQSAVRSNRIAHFQPSTACIISCVRFILSSTECLPREAPLLKRFPTLAQERKQILSVLASLVSQAKKASDETQDEDLRETEIEGMLKLGGQVFSQVRRFLAVAVQCGIDLPERRQPVTPDEAIANASDLQGQVSPAGPEDRIPASVSPDSVTPSHLSSRLATPRQPHSPDGVLQKTAPRTKSLGDLRLQRRLAAYQDSDSTISPLLPHRTILSRSKKDQYLVFERVASKHKADMPSISSISSFSSVSSGESPKPPPMPPFPSGPSTSSKVMEALKFTHDQYLSTIAAFIGHAHSHSRSSHASSTGQMYDLVREVVEMVCKLLTIVEAVMRHPEIPLHKIGNLKSAKERLYTVTSSLAESVRLLTVPLPPDLTEESEKASLIRSATAACKAGADCVSAVKICLNRASGERQFIIQIPATSDSDPAPFTPSKFSRRTGQTPALSFPTHQSLYHNGIDEDDLTVQTLTPPSPTPDATSVRDRSSDTSNVTATSYPSDGSHDTQPTMPEGGILSMSDHDLMKPMEPVSSPSPAVDDGRADERQDRQTMDTFEERLINDEPVTLQVKRDPLGHDSSTNDVVLNNEGHLVAATMEALFERMTPHDSIVDPAFSAVFFLTFRLFSTPLALVEALINRYNIMPPSNLSEDEMSIWQQHKGIPIRLRVSNFVKTWLEMYWRAEIDDIALSHLSSFTKDALLHYFPAPSHRILDLISMRQDSNTSLVSPKSERVRDPGMSINPPSYTLSEVPRPTMTKALLATLRGKNFDTVAITDFDALELARQLTIMECDLYCAIQPEEVLETGQEGTKPPINVRAVSSLSTVITGWVAENILDEHDIKKRTLLVKFFIKVADRCTSLHNFSTPRSILAALDSSTISRLHQTWLGVPHKSKMQLESLRRLADHGRNYHQYRSRLRNIAPPAVPFLGLYLTDVTFCREGNPSYRESPNAPGKKLLNFNKYHKLARIVQDMQRFQVSYNLKKIPEVQEYLQMAFEKSKHHGDLQDLYRRSLLVEPKQPADTPPPSDMRQLFNWATRSQAQPPTST
ncbi:ras guanine nucleotide exchange factor domain-containing protein [Suillus plorans]|uniref:Ras guanine nucleotide exchange factor domain-containing protein n=1 Tax=Suillus plorans TaxID=116603 RepID=A0A9P7AGT8_9AGAM|nr:ras guanine nucleotide exchange factor domain-containing protein [Suillus plorans]KAG1788161.1 ras guanine nucleotide exchange factor domain-containing protein [Suillus plorans]